MTTAQDHQAPSARARGAAALTAPGVLAFLLPLFGLLATLLLPVLAARWGAALWPRASRTLRHASAGLALTGLWLPALLAVVSGGRLGAETMAWLLLPLCAPAGAALLVPGALAAATYAVGAAASLLVRHPWPWVVGAWAAPLAYSGAARWMVDVACVA